MGYGLWAMGYGEKKNKKQVQVHLARACLHRAGAALVLDEALRREEGRTPAGCLGLLGDHGIRLLPEAAYVVVALAADS